MLMPKRVKHRKQHRGKRGGEAQRGSSVAFGEFGLQALGAAWIDSRQIESARRAITGHIKRGGKVWMVYHAWPPDSVGLEIPGRTLWLSEVTFAAGGGVKVTPPTEDYPRKP